MKTTEYIKTHNGFFTVNYEDGDSSTYKGLILMYDDKKINFNTGDPLIDWYDYCKFVCDGGAIERGIVHIGQSSSVDHWFMDSDLYTMKYLKLVDDEYIFYTDSELNNMSISQINSKNYCVINNSMETFQELKNYYKSHENRITEQIG